MEASIAKLSKYQISTFFSDNTSATQQQCDQEAERLTNMSVHATSVQRGTSYTVVSDDETCVVQFRPSSYALDVDLLECVEQAYMGFVPRHQWVGSLGELYVYTMGNVGGISMYLARDQLYKNDFSLLRQTVPDFAKYVATNVPHPPSPHVKETTQLTFTHTGFLPRHGITHRAICSVQAAPHCVTSTRRISCSSSQDFPCAFARHWTTSSRSSQASLKTIGRWCPTTPTSWRTTST